MRESAYQSHLIGSLKLLFPGCYILKNDTDYMQGIPDLLILYNDRWAMLEVKPYAGAPQQPNQEYYVYQLDALSFAAFIFPENEDAILGELKRAWS